MWNYVLCSIVVLFASLFYHYYFSKPVSIIEYPDTHYDYIIIGAGTSGCVVASRLSEIENVTVLLVEAGGYFGWISTVPILAPLMQGTLVDWGYMTEPQRSSSKGFRNHKQRIPRGKGLGGTGQMNYLVHSFGKPEDYKEWPKGWSYADILPYFKKVSNIMNVMTNPEEEYLTEAFLAAEDSFKLDNVTLQKGMYTSKRGSRWSSYQAYLQNAWNRKNLHILMNTLVSKIIVKGTKADGIKVTYNDGTSGRINARREVILSAGAISTPQLLLLSGIGPAEELGKLQIPVVKNIPEVGKNLFDHFLLPVYVNLESKVSITMFKLQTLPEVLNYFVFGRGWYATNGVMGIGRTNHSGIILFGVATMDEKFFREMGNYESQHFRLIFPSANDSMHEGCIYLAYCMQPKSRGSITLRSASVRNSPKINPAYLQHYEDVVCTQKAINLAIETLDSSKFREFGAKVHLPDFEECRDFEQDYRDINYSECVMRIAGHTGFHPCGTCRMGSDYNAVVDEKLRVKGLNKLRIIDASVLPSPISGNPNSVLIAMAERASDIIIALL